VLGAVEGEATARSLTAIGLRLARGRLRAAQGRLRDGLADLLAVGELCTLDTDHRAGARPLAAQAETELRATGARPRRLVLGGLESLTASERRVAELAGDGLTIAR
jgi:hypothetical protein